MTKSDEELRRLLTDPTNPRTPLLFKLLDHQHAGGAPFVLRLGASAFHRTDGYACGMTAAPSKPISKLFRDGDDE